jgi:hypothetical protein
MVDIEKFRIYLGNADFIKYGVVISHLVWRKTYSEIAGAFDK